MFPLKEFIIFEIRNEFIKERKSLDYLDNWINFLNQHKEDFENI